MFDTVSVQVRRPYSTGKDRLGNKIVEYETETVEGVLVAPGATLDLEASRPEGVSVAYTLHFPKTYTKSLERCLVVLPAPWTGEYRVIGNPGQYMQANTPHLLSWGMPVEVEASHG